MDKSEAKAGNGNGGSHKNNFFTTLVLDRDFVIDAALDEFLKAEGHFILNASSSAEALALAKKFQPDLILLDCELKGVKCHTLLEEMLFEHPAAAIVLLASKPGIYDTVRAIKQGAVDYFERPLDLKRLKAVIDTQKQLFKGPA